jgi:aminomethyltransferase
MLAVQGPEARVKVAELIDEPDLAELGVFASLEFSYQGSELFVARTGYTGEDGYEIVLPNTIAEAFAKSLNERGVRPCGLGARDTLRLEAGMNLYGHEMDEETSPLIANMAWTVAFDDDQRDFIGRAVLENEKQKGLSHKLVGLVIKGKGVLRADQEVSCAHSDQLGKITSGTFSPTLGTSIALARVPLEFDGECDVLIRKKKVAVDLVKPCFVRNGKALV